MVDLRRTIVITGGGSGIGRAAAILCAKRGDRVAVLDRNSAAAEETVELAIKGGAEAIACVCDVSDEGQVAAAFVASRKQFGPAWGVFANAGIDVGGMIHELPLETWNRMIATNLTGVFLTCKYGLQQILVGETASSGAGVKLDALRGSIVCTSSPCGSVALPVGGVGAYSASKGGISALVRCMAVDYARFGIRVNALVPGATETSMMWNHVPHQEVDAMRQQLNREIPLGRLGQPDDAARGVLWLLSDESAYVTGTELVCDGGVLAKASISV